MQNLTLALALIVLAVPYPLTAQSQELASPTLRIEWEEFRKLYDTQKVVVVDVRGDEAFEAGHIPGARSVPLDEIAKSAASLRKLGKPIVVYCA